MFSKLSSGQFFFVIAQLSLALIYIAAGCYLIFSMLAPGEPGMRSWKAAMVTSVGRTIVEAVEAAVIATI